MSTLHPLSLFGLDEAALLARRGSSSPFGDIPGPIEPALLLTSVAIAPTPTGSTDTPAVAEPPTRPPVRPTPDRALGPVLRVAPRTSARWDHLAAAALIAVLLAVVVASGLAVRPAALAAPSGPLLAAMPAVPPTAAQLAATASRAQAAEQLLRNPALIVSDEATPLLAEGRVDGRLILILGQSLATAPTRVADFPAGDDDVAGVRHRMLVGTYQGFPLTRNQSSTPTPEAVAAATAWMAQLTGVFEPSSIELTDAGLLITLDPDEPSGILPPVTAAERAGS